MNKINTLSWNATYFSERKSTLKLKIKTSENPQIFVHAFSMFPSISSEINVNHPWTENSGELLILCKLIKKSL